MFGNRSSAAQAYATIGIETAAGAASPHQLIVMLFDGALAAISTAQHALDDPRGINIETKVTAISKALRIITDGLRSSLDKAAGGPLADQLDELYLYICKELTLANATNNRAQLAAARRLLNELAEAWKTMPNRLPAAPPGAAAAAA